MSEKSTLRQKALKAIRDGKMPRQYPKHLWGGPSSGARCTICGEPTNSGEIEFELEFTPPGDHRGHGNPTVHKRCFSEWEAACQDLEAGRCEPVRSRNPIAVEGLPAQSRDLPSEPDELP
jgi:hypothetical protein